MKKLANLCQIVTLRGPLSLPLLDLNDLAETKEMQLVQSLLAKPDATQNQLVRELYGQNTPAHVEAFWQLRTRLQAKLLNHLYFLDQADARYPVERRYDMALWQMLHQASVLQAEGEYPMAEQRLRRGPAPGRAGRLRASRRAGRPAAAQPLRQPAPARQVRAGRPPLRRAKPTPAGRRRSRGAAHGGA